MQPERLAALRPSWAQALPRGMAPFAAGLALAFTLQLVVVPLVGDFWARLLMDIGINITLAVSLNMVNGYTGQFAIGHAAFMAVGGYVAGAVTYYGSYLWLDALGPTGRPVVSGAFLGAGDLTFQNGAGRDVNLFMAVVIQQIAQHQRGAGQPRHQPQGGHVRAQHIVAIALFPAGGFIAGNGVHLHIDGEEIVAAMGFFMSAIAEKGGVKAFAHQAALHVDAGHEDSVNLALGNKGFQSV